MRQLNFTLLALLTVLLALPSCNDDENNCIRGAGALETRMLTIDAFTGINALGSYNVEIKPGPIQRVEVSGFPNVIDRMKTAVVGGIWNIELEEGCYDNLTLGVVITLPQIRNITLTGSGNIDVEHFADQADLDVSIIGSGNISMKSFTGTKNFSASIVGSGDFIGTFDFVDLEMLAIAIAGSGSFQGFPIRTDVCTINIAGSGDSEVYVNDILNVTITGSGDVRYLGDPVVDANISGSGQVINAN